MIKTCDPGDLKVACFEIFFLTPVENEVKSAGVGCPIVVITLTLHYACSFLRGKLYAENDVINLFRAGADDPSSETRQMTVEQSHSSPGEPEVLGTLSRAITSPSTVSLMFIGNLSSF